MANECMWCVDGKLVEVERGKWRCNKCHAMHDQVVDKGGPGDQEKVHYEPTPGQQEPSYIGLRRDGGHLTATEVVEARKKYAEDHPLPTFAGGVVETLAEFMAKPGVSDHPYAKLREVLERAFIQASGGKGKERHAEDGEAFEDQVICEVRRRVGHGYTRGQAVKKIYEAGRLPKDRAVAELLGAINYIAADIIVLEGEA